MPIRGPRPRGPAQAGVVLICTVPFRAAMVPTMNSKELFQAGKLAEAIQALGAELRDNPDRSRAPHVPVRAAVFRRRIRPRRKASRHPGAGRQRSRTGRPALPRRPACRAHAGTSCSARSEYPRAAIGGTEPPPVSGTLNGKPFESLDRRRSAHRARAWKSSPPASTCGSRSRTSSPSRCSPRDGCGTCCGRPRWSHRPGVQGPGTGRGADPRADARWPGAAPRTMPCGWAALTEWEETDGRRGGAGRAEDAAGGRRGLPHSGVAPPGDPRGEDGRARAMPLRMTSSTPSRATTRRAKTCATRPSTTRSRRRAGKTTTPRRATGRASAK